MKPDPPARLALVLMLVALMLMWLGVRACVIWAPPQHAQAQADATPERAAIRGR